MPHTHPYGSPTCTEEGCRESRSHPIHHINPGREEVLEPNYEQTLKFLAQAVGEGSHEQPMIAMYSILDMMRYLTQTDTPAALRVVKYFQARAGYTRDEAGGEDSHLEADYEDRFAEDR